ncbi:MAG: hypothetical protein WCD70_02870 [Alphaproteobacteria bacterium]
MDWLSFISSLISSLAWPAVAAIFLFMMRGRIGILINALASRITKAKLPGGIELEFSEKIEEAREESEVLAMEGKLVAAFKQNQPESLAKVEDKYLTLAQVSPEAAVLEAFKEVEMAIMDNKAELPEIKGGNLFAFVRQLHLAEFIDQKVVDQFQRVRELRNLAVHSKEPLAISIGEAMEYRSLCLSLASTLRFVFAQMNHARQPG